MFKGLHQKYFKKEKKRKRKKKIPPPKPQIAIDEQQLYY